MAALVFDAFVVEGDEFVSRVVSHVGGSPRTVTLLSCSFVQHAEAGRNSRGRSRRGTQALVHQSSTIGVMDRAKSSQVPFLQKHLQG